MPNYVLTQFQFTDQESNPKSINFTQNYPKSSLPQNHQKLILPKITHNRVLPNYNLKYPKINVGHKMSQIQFWLEITKNDPT